MVAPALIAASIAAQVMAQQQRRRQEAQRRQEMSNAEIGRLTARGGAPAVSAQPGGRPRAANMLAQGAMQRQDIIHPLQGMGQLAQAAAARYLMSQQGAGNNALLDLAEPESNPEIEALLRRGEI